MQGEVEMRPVAVVDRKEYDALVAERDLLSTALVRRRVGALLAAFTLAMGAALGAFMGGFWVGQLMNDESFKAACSRVVDEAVKGVRSQGGKMVQIEAPPADPVEKVRY
jgi:hypothetical protein